ncbi:hypothetical protein GPECTOR_115g332 [Gonium pectorale]|uniref:SCP domain-containing protein n=1 Tax=Gonium pectorale TaxID=33097 RepID=A0A150FZ25_GONPE|nr:hypothetical protein GPECTOR_115g332 [Gonium pectorale]|eukprot:KXZ42838.1 hypothetical protein GPECTOR_115g332 [Gonium pectorale]
MSVVRSLQQSGCSTTDASAAAILACTNAVRINPDVLSDASCFASVQAEIKWPPRLPLSNNSFLAEAADYHNSWMAWDDTLTHQVNGELALGDRVTAFGYSWSRVSENVAWGYKSAKDVVSGWLCSSGHRANMFSCNYADIGVAADTDWLYYTQASRLVGKLWLPGRQDLLQLRQHQILACTNAVRVNPDVLSDASCFASVQAELKNPPRLPLNYDANLTAAAVYHNNWMVSYSTMSHQLSGEPSLGDRASMHSYNWWRIAENVAAGYGSAKSVVSGWLWWGGGERLKPR